MLGCSLGDHLELASLLSQSQKQGGERGLASPEGSLFAFLAARLPLRWSM